MPQSVETDLLAVVPDSNILWVFIALNAVQLVWTLAKSIWDSHRAKSDHTAEKVDKLLMAFDRFEHQIDVLTERVKHVPTPREIELLVWEKVREFIK